MAAAQDLQLGKKTFNKVCAECHGKDGRGEGPKAQSAGFKPRDLSLGSFKCRCTESGQLPSDDDLLRSIVEGLPGSAMPAHPDLTEEQAVSLVDYTKKFSNRFAEETQPPCIALPSSAPPSTPERAAAGKQIYRLLSCDSCHGVEGLGDGPSAQGLTDDWGEPIKVHNFVRLRKLKCGNDDVDVYRTLHTGLNGAPMPSYQEAFLFAPEQPPDLSVVGDRYGEPAVNELRQYLAGQPRRSELEDMPAADRQELIEQRTWSLVQYVKSLIPARGGR